MTDSPPITSHGDGRHARRAPADSARSTRCRSVGSSGIRAISFQIQLAGTNASDPPREPDALPTACRARYVPQGLAVRARGPRAQLHHDPERRTRMIRAHDGVATSGATFPPSERAGVPTTCGACSLGPARRVMRRWEQLDAHRRARIRARGRQITSRRALRNNAGCTPIAQTRPKSPGLVGRQGLCNRKR
jgi:hypothetical protein